jgi:hypothetical protein
MIEAAAKVEARGSSSSSGSSSSAAAEKRSRLGLVVQDDDDRSNARGRGRPGRAGDDGVDRDADRSWYDADENGQVVDAEASRELFVGNEDKFKKKVAEQVQKKHRVSLRQQQVNADNEAWEENRLITAGTAPLASALI